MSWEDRPHADRLRPVSARHGPSTRRPLRAGIVATGVAYRRLDAPGVEELVGCGVSYGSVPAEAPSHRDQDVVLVGGANSAGQAALHLAQYARTVTMIVRAPSLDAGMSRYLVDRIRSHPRIKSAPAVASPGRQA